MSVFVCEMVGMSEELLGRECKDRLACAECGFFVFSRGHGECAEKFLNRC